MDWTRREVFTLPAAIPAAAAPMAATHLALIGTYTRDDSKGIYAADFDAASGQLANVRVAAEIANPSFIALHPNARVVYAVGELGEFQGQKAGAVHAFALDRTAGKLTLLNSQSTGGPGPCHLVADPTGKSLIAVNYSGGSVAVFPLEANGSLGARSAFVQHSGSSVNSRRQEGPHAHSVNLSKNNRWAVVADLGVDEYIVYAFDAAKGTVARSSAAKPKAGAGPRHFAFHPSYRFAYGVNELNSTVSVFQWDEEKGVLTEIQAITTLPEGYSGDTTCAEILVHSNGKSVYASNRGHDSIASFSVGADGKLTATGHTSTGGKTPRNFRLDPTGRWLVAANQNSANLVTLKIDPVKGTLTPAGQPVRVPFPVCIKFV
jgi:6-phosphogluconolactonase